jgi:hypothetical protein
MLTPVLRIRDVYPGYQIRSGIKKIPDPGSGSKNLSIFKPKNCFQALGKIIWDVHPGSRGKKKLRIPDPDPQHWLTPTRGFRNVNGCSNDQDQKYCTYSLSIVSP